MILSFFFLDLIHVAKVHILWIEYVLHVNISFGIRAFKSYLCFGVVFLHEILCYIWYL